MDVDAEGVSGCVHQHPLPPTSTDGVLGRDSFKHNVSILGKGG